VFVGHTDFRKWVDSIPGRRLNGADRRQGRRGHGIKAGVMDIDIRDRTTIGHGDVTGLNFVRRSVPFIFRRHYRSGLRSHILEVLDPADVEREKRGTTVGGMRWFPRAVPLKMLRIFRTRFRSLADALAEIGRVKSVEVFLGTDFMAVSEEFLVDYIGPAGRDFLLCGLQEFVAGDPVDPWRSPPFIDYAAGMPCAGPSTVSVHPPCESDRTRRLRASTAEFVKRVKTMIQRAHLIPDLAGARNLIATPGGRLKLVDINNISPITISDEICVDNRGYPVCDKSVEALFLLEEKLVGRLADPADGIYRHFLEPGRMQRVAAIDCRFHQRVKSGSEPL